MSGLGITSVPGMVQAIAEATYQSPGVQPTPGYHTGDPTHVHVALAPCQVEACTSPSTQHHHHRALDRQPSAWACSCRHGGESR